MKSILAIILSSALASALNADEKKNTFISKDLGISMEVPVAKGDGGSAYQVAMFFLPVSEGFAANVNVQKQKYAGSLEDYDKLSVSQFKSLKMTIVHREAREGEIVYNYTGNMGGKDLCWYAKAIKEGEYVYLITATGLQSQWERQKSELMKSVSSFRVAK